MSLDTTTTTRHECDWCEEMFPEDAMVPAKVGPLSVFLCWECAGLDDD